MSKRTKTIAEELSGDYFAEDTSACAAGCQQDQIRRRAYELFEIRGRQSGHELEDWLQAEREIRSHLGL